MNRKINLYKKILFLAFISGAVYLTLLLPVFKIDEIIITGNGKLPKSQIEEIIRQNKGKTLYTFSSRTARDELKKNPYIVNVDFTRTFPDKLTVGVTERVLSGYVQYMNGEYIYIDEEGTVLEIAPDYTERLPVVVGLSFNAFSIGQPILPDNSATFDTLVELHYLFNKYELEHEVIRVDLRNENNIHLYVYNIDVDFGDIANADEKIRALKEIIYKIPAYETVNGFLDMNGINKNELARFRRLT